MKNKIFFSNSFACCYVPCFDLFPSCSTSGFAASAPCAKLECVSVATSFARCATTIAPPVSAKVGEFDGSALGVARQQGYVPESSEDFPAALQDSRSSSPSARISRTRRCKHSPWIVSSNAPGGVRYCFSKTPRHV